MAQLSLYLDAPTFELLKGNAEREKLSLSKMAQRAIASYANHGWNEGFWDLYGAVDDGTFVAPAELPLELDAPREVL